MPRILPIRHQPALPLDRLILREPPSAETMEMDVLIVGAGPAGLACAIELARLAKKDGGTINVGVLEKAETLGEHSLSGAVALLYFDAKARAEERWLTERHRGYQRYTVHVRRRVI